MMLLNCADRLLNLSTPKVMGILNVTIDSFSDGGCYYDPSVAVKHAVAMVADGAAIIDVGGESTRPGAQAVSLDQELERVIPVIEALQHEVDVPISIDTSKARVMQEAVKAGAGFINDVYALQAPGALQVAKSCNVPICLMHMQGQPQIMQDKPYYDDVVKEVKAFLSARAQICVTEGIAKQNIMIDPGFGFGKTDAHNLVLMKGLESFSQLGISLMLGVSRKSTIGRVLQRSIKERLAGSLALAVLAVKQGVKLIRTHDVKETVDVINMTASVLSNPNSG